MPSRGGRAPHEVASKLDRTWRHVIRALPSNGNLRAEGLRLRDLLENDKADAGAVNERFLKFRGRCDAVLSKDLEFGVELKLSDGGKEIQLEYHLWNTHTHVNTWYRRQLETFKQYQKKNVVEHRKLQKRFLEFVKSSQIYYRTHVARLAANGGGIPKLKAIAKKVALEDIKVSPDGSFVSEELEAVSSSCFEALIHLGDLSRWREAARTEGEANYSPAVGFYDLAHAFDPYSGKPYHQLAVIASLHPTPDDLRVVYYFYRSLCTKSPHPKAADNLDQQFQKIMSRFDPQRALAFRQKEQQDTVTDLISWHMQLHAKCRMSPDFDEYAELERNVLGYLAMNVLEIPMGSVLKKIVLVNLAAEWIATEMAHRPSDCPVAYHLARHYFLKLNVRTMETLLGMLANELDSVNAGGPFGSPAPQRAEDKVTPVMRRILPSLVNYSSWLVITAEVFSTVIGDGPFFTAFSSDVAYFWRTYSATLTKLIHTFELTDLPDIEYLLEEDEETLGFFPFQDKELQPRYMLGGRRRLDASLVQRFHPTKEMLGRLRRLAFDGRKLSLMKTTPISMEKAGDGGRLSFEFSTVDRQPCFPGAAGQEGTNLLDEESELHHKDMVNQLVDTGDPCYVKSPSGRGRGVHKFHLAPSRTRTPPAYTFEDPAFDIDPFKPAPPAEETGPSGYASMPVVHYNEDVMADDERMAWMSREICQAEEPTVPPVNYGYSEHSKTLF